MLATRDQPVRDLRKSAVVVHHFLTSVLHVRRAKEYQKSLFLRPGLRFPVRELADITVKAVILVPLSDLPGDCDELRTSQQHIYSKTLVITTGDWGYVAFTDVHLPRRRVFDTWKIIVPV